MNKKLTIGILLPNSTIMPMGKDFEKGLKNGLKPLLNDDNEWDLEIIPQFIGQGAKEDVQTAIDKLIGYDNADIITGIVSNRTGAEVAEKFESRKNIFLMNNLGEHLPNPENFNSNIFINSINLWQQVWSLGYWGVKNFGNKGMFVAGLYDAGYSFSAMLQAGMQAANPESKMPFATTPPPKTGGLCDVVSVFQHIEEFNPDFVMAAFCGQEANIFLAEYINRGLHKTKPLLGLPFLLQTSQIEENIDIYTTISSYNNTIHQKLSQAEKVTVNPYAQLGYESGLAISDVLKTKNISDLKEGLSNIKSESERGRLNMKASDPGRDSRIFLIKNRIQKDPQQSTIELVEEIPTVYIDNEQIQKILSEFSSGWYNPYLGV